MVLFKRKPVRFRQIPPHLKDNDEVWYIKATGEVFPAYDEYLARMDFYKQRRFNCQITGRSNLNFFDALESERAGAAEVEQSFPEALKGPVLRRVQFQTISRIDTLVDQIYDEFKADYHPGEAVTVVLSNGERLHGVVRDKTRYGSKVLPDGTLTPPYTRYIVSLDGRRGEEAVVEEANISRDRKVFTKSVLRSFIKKTVSREAWNGAPWLVKPDVAEAYHIDTRVPANLLYNTKMLERKQLLAQKRQTQLPLDRNLVDGDPGSPETIAGGVLRLPELKPGPKSHKAKNPLAGLTERERREYEQQERKMQRRQLSNGSWKARPSAFAHHPEPGHFQHLPLPNNPFQFSLSMRKQNLTPPGHYYTVQEAPAPPPPPPAPKYPIEDLQLEPTMSSRPALHFLCRDRPAANSATDGVTNGAVNGTENGSPNAVAKAATSAVSSKVLMQSVGPLLETWDTLNVYCEIFKLDSFTFDDFAEALIYASVETPVRMVDEIHCSILKTLVQAEANGGQVQIQLPELDADDDNEEEGEENDEAKGEGQEEEEEPAPEPKHATRATRRSLAKLEADRLAAEATAAAEKEKDDEPVVVHRADEALAGFDWIDELRKRNFRDGGWQLIVVGLLRQLSKNERRKAACEALLAQIVPPNITEPTKETVREQYLALDINARVALLQILCMLTMETKAIRGYMEDCSEQMTKYRKEKIEWQRSRKQYIEDLKLLNDQRKILLPDNMPPSPRQDLSKAGGDVKMSDAEDLSAAGDDTEEEDGVPTRARGRSLRRADDRAAERRRKREEEQERKKEAEAAAKAPKQSKQFIKLLRDIEKKEADIKNCEDEIATLDNDLREADCPRTRVLGKDRFWNRYYWFERNGMPYGGLPTSSTADAEYANGCIWVQGPDELERVGYIDMAPEHQKEYAAKFGMTVPERKAQEEGATSLRSASQWGFFSEPKELDELIGWLDPRGFNEMKLRKELVTFRSKIVANMEHRKKYIAGEDGDSSDVATTTATATAADDADDNDDSAAETTLAGKSGGGGGASKRMSTRMRHVAAATVATAAAVATPEPAAAARAPPVLRCTRWENSMALEDLGHLHSEPPLAVRSRKQSRKKDVADEAIEPPRKKAMTRQGARNH